MPSKQTIEDLDLSDTELIRVLKNHGMDRRMLMKLFGAGVVMSALGGGTAAAKPGNRIDREFGAPYSKHDKVPGGLVDHMVELHVHGGGSDGEHKGFPVPDDAVDADRRTPGFQSDTDDDDDLPEFHFEPVGLRVQPGDVVKFKNVSTEHTVSSFHPKFSNPQISFPRRIPNNARGFTSPPFVEDESWLYKFRKPGVYDLFCFPHLPLGMTMRIVVGDGSFSDYPDLMHPAFGNANTVLNTPELDDPNAMADEVKWENLSIPVPPLTSVPRPSVGNLSVTEVGTSSTDAEFDVPWAVSDPTGDLDTVIIRLIDNTDGGTEDLAAKLVSGGSASGTEHLVASGDEGSSNDYTVELVVSDASGLSETARTTITES